MEPELESSHNPYTLCLFVVFQNTGHFRVMPRIMCSIFEMGKTLANHRVICQIHRSFPPPTFPLYGIIITLFIITL